MILRLLALFVMRNEACRRTCGCVISFVYVRLVTSVLELLEEVVFHGIIFTRACLLECGFYWNEGDCLFQSAKHSRFYIRFRVKGERQFLSCVRPPVCP